MSRHFPMEDIQMAKHTHTHTNMPNISHCKTKIKTIVKYHCILTKRTIIKNRTIKTNFWQKYGEIEMLILCWWEYEMVQPLGKQFFRKLNIELLYDPAFLLLDIYPREMKTSVQFSCHSVVSDSLQPHEPQHARPCCPSPTPRVYPNSCPLSWWSHPTISSSVIPFSSCPQSFPASGSFQMNQLCASGGQGIRVSASTSVLPRTDFL